jgi:hypothetical protein
VDLNDDSVILLCPLNQPQIHSITYEGVEYNFYSFSEQLKENILATWKRLVELGLVNQEFISILKEILSVDLRKIIIPEKIVLADGREIDSKNLIKNKSVSDD